MMIRRQKSEDRRRKVGTAALCLFARVSFCLLLSVFCPLYAEDLPDPTRPPASIFAPAAGVGVTQEGAAENHSRGLHTIIISATRRAAIIDGQIVELGDEHGGAKLIEVNEGGVVLQRAQSRQVLPLFPDIKITRKKMPGKESTENGLPNNKKSQLKKASSASKVQSGKHKTRPTVHYEKLLMEPLAIPPGSQTTATKRLVMSGHPREEK